MKNPFKRTHFDNYIGAGTQIFGELRLASGQVTVIDGDVTSKSAIFVNEGDLKATLHIGGSVQVADLIIPNVIITGKVTCNELRADATLAIKAGAEVTAEAIHYRHLIIEPGAIVNARLVPISGT